MLLSPGRVDWLLTWLHLLLDFCCTSMEGGFSHARPLLSLSTFLSNDTECTGEQARVNRSCFLLLALISDLQHFVGQSFTSRTVVSTLIHLTQRFIMVYP